MNSKKSKLSIGLGILSLTTIVLLPVKIRAATDVWTGGGTNNNWSTAANWGGTAPNATGDNLIFAGSAQPNNTNNLVTSVGWVQLNPSLAFTNNGTALTINTGMTNSAFNNVWKIPLTLSADQNFDVASGTTLTLGGVISGSFGFSASKAGTLILTGANTYSGTTTVNAGTVNVGNGGSTGSLGTNAIVDNSALVYNLVGTSTTATLPVAGITGTGTIAVNADTIVLNGNVTTVSNQTYTATTAGLNNHGIKALGSPGTILTASNGASITMSGDVGYLNTGSGGALTMDTSSGNGTINLYISVGRYNSLYQVNSVTANAGTGTINVTGTSNGGGWNGCPVSLTGAMNITGNVAFNSGALTLNASAAGSVSGNLSGSMSLIKTGSSPLILSNPNTYTGATTISNGTLIVNGSVSNSPVAVASGATLGGSGAIFGTTTVQSGGALGLAGGSGTLILKSLTLGSGISDNVTVNCTATNGGAGSFNVTGLNGLTNNGTVTIIVGSAASLAPGTYTLITYSGSVQGGGSFVAGSVSSQGVAYLVNNPSASAIQLVVTSPNNAVAWVGTPLNNWDMLGSNVWRWVTNGVPTSYQDGTQTVFDDSASNFTVNIAATVAPLTVVVSNSINNYFFTGSGHIVGIARLTKQGSGTLTLATTNTYASPTTVSGGALLVNASIGMSTVTVQTNATLGGTGSIGGATIIQTGGTLTIGSANPGTLAISNTLALNAGSTTVMRVNRTAGVLSNDQIKGMTGVTYGGTLNVTTSGDTLVLGDKFVLFNKKSGSYGGSFATLNLPPPPAGLKWDTSGLMMDGSILVVSGNFGNILPLGDQFTDGSPVVGGYRDPLYTLLTNAGSTFNFIGSTNDNATATLTSAGQDHHEGHSGYFIAGQAVTGVPTPNGMGGLYENLGTWIGTNGVQPNIILLMIGGNDIGYDYANGWTNATTRLTTLINQIYHWQPNVTLYAGSVTPRSVGYGSWTAADLTSYIRTYNAAIPGIVGAEQALGRDVHFADIYNSITTNDLSGDGIDPSAGGYQKIAAAWAGALASFSTPQAVYYVSPAGSDTNAGTFDQPFATLAKAQGVVRTINTNMTGDIIVYLRGGTYPLTNSLTFAPADSGNNGHKIIYRAYAPEAPVISGGRMITGWTLHDAGKNIWQASVSPTDNFRQLYVNGVKAVRAYGAAPAGYAVTATGYTTTDTNLQLYGNITNLEIVTHSVNWTQSRLPVASILGTSIAIQQPCLGLAPTVYNNALTGPTRMENAYEFMNSPGYWYLNLYTHTLYYIPRAGESLATATVEAPVVEQLVAITGDSTNPVSNLSFVGLTFRLSNWLQPSTGLGLASGQANQDTLSTNYLWVVKAAVDCTGARNVGVTACTFRELGGDGINFLRASQNDTVNSCAFYDIAASAVQAARGNEMDTLIPIGSGDIVSGIVITGCTIHDVCTDYQEGCGIYFGYTANCTISHNEIYNTPYSAISLGWGWTTYVAAYAGGNQIAYNKIHDHMQVLADGGAIYVNGAQPNGRGLMAWNYIYNQGNVFGELYVDDGGSNWTVASNVCQKASAATWYLYKGSNNNADDNYTDDTSAPMNETTGPLPSTVSNTTVVTNGIWPQGALDIMNAAGAGNIASVTLAGSGTFTNLNGGSWATAANWNGGTIASGSDNTADFSTLTLNGAPTVTLDGAQTIGNMIFGDMGNAYGWTLSPGSGGSLTLAVSSGSPTVTVNGQTNTIGLVLAGTNGLTKAGPGTLTFIGGNSYTGGTTIASGTLQVGNGGSTGSLGTGAIVDNSTLAYNLNSSSTVSLPSSISGTGNLTASAEIMQLNGNITLGGSQGYTENGGGSLYTGIEVVGANVTLTGSTITLAGDVGKRSSNGNNLTLDTSAVNGPVNLNLSLGRVNVWYGLTSCTVNAGTGTINVTGSGSASSGWNSPMILNGTLNITANIGNVGAAVFHATANSTISGNLGLAQSSHGLNIVNVDNGATLTVSGQLSGVSNVSWGGYQKQGLGTLKLQNTNAGLGHGTEVDAGTINFVHGALPSHNTAEGVAGYAIDFEGNATLQWASGNTDDLSASGNLKIGDGFTATLDTGTNNVTLGTAIVLGTAKTGGITKLGTGTVTLSGANTYTGTTTISNGTLRVNGSLAAGSAVTVAVGGTLGGTGTVNGPVTVNGTIAPGASVGTLNTGAETWNGGGSYVCEINSTNATGRDLLNITGALNVQATSGSNFTVKLVSLTVGNSPGLLTNFNKFANYTWTIATTSGGVSNFATSKFASDTSTFSNDFSGGVFSLAVAGNNLVLNYTAAPPVFNAIARLGGGGMQLAGMGSMGQAYVLLATTNLVPANWIPIATNTADTNGAVQFTDPQATNYGRRFYHLSTP